MGIPYNLSQPTSVYRLPDELVEISGIYPIGMRYLACVEDEHQNIYLFDRHTETIAHQLGLGQAGDAEDIVILDDTAYVLFARQREICKYGNFRTSMSNPERYDLELDRAHDPEGLCYDSKHNQLLVACKGNPDANSTKRQVFQFDLANGRRHRTPLFTIDGQDICSSASADDTFNPSGIAIHPETHDIYMLSTRNWKMVLRLDESGQQILGKKKLDENVFNQPEGITFSASGELFIASEGEQDDNGEVEIPGKIFRFAP